MMGIPSMWRYKICTTIAGLFSTQNSVLEHCRSMWGLPLASGKVCLTAAADSLLHLFSPLLQISWPLSLAPGAALPVHAHVIKASAPMTIPS